ncbi:MAG: hypothetical protein WCK35_24680 [Chloroflexota bacterium]
MRDDNQTTYTRLLEIMGRGSSLGEHPIGGTYIGVPPGNGFDRICLFEYEKAPQNTFSLAIFAGNTCKQARELYNHFSYAKVIDLEKDGWTVASNFHFAWQRKNILDTRADQALALSEYIAYWSSATGKKNNRLYKRDEFDLLRDTLRAAKMMDDQDIADFSEYFRTHKYQSVITCPGIINRISYPIARLDENTESLAAELKDKMMSLHKIYSRNAR